MYYERYDLLIKWEFYSFLTLYIFVSIFGHFELRFLNIIYQCSYVNKCFSVNLENESVRVL